MSTHHRYGPNGEYLGSSVYKGDGKIENYDEIGRQVSTSWVQEDRVEMVSLVVVYGISGRECAGVCPGRTSTGDYRSLNRRRATA